MNKKIGISFFVALLVFLTSHTLTFAVFGVKATIVEERKEFRASVSAERQEFKGELRATRGEIREMRASVSAEMLQKREEFKLKLQTIRDERKKMVVEKISTRTGEINQKRTGEMMGVLEKMSEIIDRIANSKLSAKGGSALGGQVQSSKLEDLITAARSAIETAKSAVTAQAQKEYVISITTESALRTTVGATISQLQNDLRTPREKVIAARKAVQDVFAEMMKLKVTGEASRSGVLNR